MFLSRFFWNLVQAQTQWSQSKVQKDTSGCTLGNSIEPVSCTGFEYIEKCPYIWKQRTRKIFFSSAKSTNSSFLEHNQIKAQL